MVMPCTNCWLVFRMDLRMAASTSEAFILGFFSYTLRCSVASSRSILRTALSVRRGKQTSSPLVSLR